MPSLPTPATAGDLPIPPARRRRGLITILYGDQVTSLVPGGQEGGAVQP